ncbi:hypothetical protein F5148DRAFT_1368107 [Russula earlei]|uniref:Uncharacterized protein n=1 Tax=Russula earlei TaxID=71964 RepID=A0ACC0U9S3_9AGAM|nr:hypothetical protein F5148DRAFT_1368107 [Russula earlei]
MPLKPHDEAATWCYPTHLHLIAVHAHRLVYTPHMRELATAVFFIVERRKTGENTKETVARRVASGSSAFNWMRFRRFRRQPNLREPNCAVTPILHWDFDRRRSTSVRHGDAGEGTRVSPVACGDGFTTAATRGLAAYKMEGRGKASSIHSDVASELDHSCRARLVEKTVDGDPVVSSLSSTGSGVALYFPNPDWMPNPSFTDSLKGFSIDQRFHRAKVTGALRFLPDRFYPTVHVNSKNKGCTIYGTMPPRRVTPWASHASLPSDRIRPSPSQPANPEKGKEKGKGKGKAMAAAAPDPPRSAAVRGLDEPLAGLNSSESTQPSHNKSSQKATTATGTGPQADPREGCFGQPACTPCRNIRHSARPAASSSAPLHPPHRLCPHCARPLLTLPARAALIAQLEELRDQTLAEEAAAREREAEAVRLAEGAFPTLGPSPPPPQQQAAAGPARYGARRRWTPRALGRFAHGSRHGRLVFEFFGRRARR